MSEDHVGGAGLDLETLVDYIDGRLGADERRAVDDLLDRSEDARDVLAEAIRLRGELDGEAEGEGVRAPPRWIGRPRRPFWIPAAALAAAAGAAGLFLNLGAPRDRPPGRAVSRLLDATVVRGHPDWAAPARPAARGERPEDTGRSAVRAGVLWVDLRMAREGGDAARAAALAGEIVALIEALPLATPAAAAIRSVGGEGAGAPPELATLDRAEEALAATLDPRWFHAGIWLEAVRLAGLTRQPRLLRDAAVSGALAELATADWPPGVGARLGSLADLIASGGAPPEAAREAAESIIRSLDR